MRKRWLAACLLVLTACGGGAEGPQTIYFSGLETDEFEPSVIGDPGPRASDEQIEKMSEVFASFEGDPARVLSSPLLTPGQLDSIENAYVTSGRYLDLVAMYRRVAEAQGLGSRAAARHTWAMIRLGQGKRARDAALALVRHDPTKPRPWFIYGAAHLELAQSSDEDAERAYVAWKHAAELDPKFRGIEGFTARDLLAEAARLEPKVKKDEAGLAALRDSIAGAKPSEATEGATPPAPAPDTPPEAPAPEDPAGAPAPDADPAPAEPVAEKPADAAPEAPAEAPAVAPEVGGPEPLALGLMRSRMALSGGDDAGAKAALAIARSAHLGLEADDVVTRIVGVSYSDAIEYVRLEWAVGDKTRAARAWRALAKKQGFAPRERFEIAMFGARELEDFATALELLRALEKEEPEFSKSAGVGAAIESMTR